MVSTTNIPITGRRRRHVQRPTIAGERLRFDKSGRVLSREEQEKIAKARGLCPGCGLRTHAVSTYRHRLLPMDNEYVSNGVCRVCRPTSKNTALLQRASKPFLSSADPKRMVSFDTNGPPDVSPGVETKDGAGKVPSKRSFSEEQGAVRGLSAAPEEVDDDKDDNDSTHTDMSAMRLLSEEATDNVSPRAIAGKKSMTQMTSSDNVDVLVEAPRSSKIESDNSQNSAKRVARAKSEGSMTSIMESLRLNGFDPDEFLLQSVRNSIASEFISVTDAPDPNATVQPRRDSSEGSMTSIMESLRLNGFDPDEFLLQSVRNSIASEFISVTGADPNATVRPRRDTIASATGMDSIYELMRKTQMTSSDNVGVPVETPRSSMMDGAISQYSAKRVASEGSMTNIMESLRLNGFDPDELLLQSVRDNVTDADPNATVQPRRDSTVSATGMDSKTQMTSSDNVGVPVETPRSSMMDSANSQNSAKRLASEGSMTSIMESLRLNGFDPDEFLLQSVGDNIASECISVTDAPDPNATVQPRRDTIASATGMDSIYELTSKTQMTSSDNVDVPVETPHSSMMDNAISQNSAKRLTSEGSTRSIMKSLRLNGFDPDEFLLQSVRDNIASECISVTDADPNATVQPRRDSIASATSMDSIYELMQQIRVETPRSSIVARARSDSMTSIKESLRLNGFDPDEFLLRSFG